MSHNTGFEFDQVVFFGRSLEEYVLMFNLELQQLRGSKVLDCCAGPAAFARQGNEWGIEIVACDPLYTRSLEELRAIVDRDAASVSEKQKKTPEYFHPELVPTSVRRQAMEIFLQDIQNCADSGRYVTGSLPALPFADQTFDLVLCGNFLFLYSEVGTGGMMEHSALSYEFHRRALAELIRVSKSEVRIYPLQGPKVEEHSYLRPLMKELSAQGLTTTLQPVRQRDIKGAERLLSIAR
jgi:hypothetical protein